VVAVTVAYRVSEIFQRTNNISRIGQKKDGSLGNLKTRRRRNEEGETKDRFRIMHAVLFALIRDT
jgi:hypothetical protein